MCISVPWVLVSALGQRDGDGAALLGLCVCRGLMEELRLFRMALGAAELASAWAAVAPRKPEQKAGQEGGDRETVRSAAAVPSKFLEIIAGCGEEKKKHPAAAISQESHQTVINGTAKRSERNI